MEAATLVGILPVVGAAVSIASISLFRNYDSIRRCSRLQYSPANAAFGIWSVIYLSTFALLVAEPLLTTPPDEYYSLLFMASWLTTAAWGVAGRSEELHARLWIACSLISGTLFGLAALYRARDYGSDYNRFLLLTGPCALLVGWLACATLLGVGLYFKDCGVVYLPPDPSPSIVPLVASIVLASLAILLRTPVLMVGVLVLVVAQRSGPTIVHTLALLIIVTGSVLSVLLAALGYLSW